MSIQKKFLGANTVGAEKIRLESDSAVRARNAANSADVELFKLDSADIFKLLKLPRVDAALPAPSDSKDLATKGYVDDLLGGGSGNGYAPLGNDGKIPNQYYSSLVITDVYVVADIAARDALTGIETGDVAKVTDAGAGLPKTYIYGGSPAGWIELESGSDVDSVNGYTGAVVLAASDIGSSGASTVQADIDALESEDLTFLKLDGSRPMTGDLDMGGFAVLNAASVTAVSGTAETFVDGFGVNMTDSAGSAQVVLTTQSIDSAEAFSIITQTGALGLQAADSFIELAALDSVKITAPKLDMGLKDILDAAQLQVVEVAGGASGLVSGLTPGALVVSDNATGKASEINYEQISVDDGTDSVTINSSTITGGLNLSLLTSGALNVTSSGAAINLAASGGIDLSPGAGFEVFVHEQLNMQSAKIVSLADGVAASDAATVGQVDSAISSAVTTINGDISALQAEDLTFLKLDGSRPMTGDLDLGGNDITLVGEVSGSAVTITSSAGAVTLSPGIGQKVVAFGELDVQTHKIVNLVAGTDATDAVNKGQMESYADQAEADAISSANTYTDGQLDALSVQELVHESKTLVAGDITNGYVDVAFAIQGQPWIQVGRVSLVPGDDFTISGSRITFAGSVAAAGAEALASGDKLSIFYMKSIQPYV